MKEFYHINFKEGKHKELYKAYKFGNKINQNKQTPSLAFNTIFYEWYCIS